ncbi:hypothetical protein Rvan_2441 [Rhodomicrobium vannielii ATCC 17100]|uniref:DUF4160 domain-containing protein n=1 Tax=Rhodomicrobium vannielii (strain ATCC 17100 / DSM 162 / LMG 4299 / NCIMB 10020 / ATH 3.1.1) TaxID=648757 RepID=E3I5E0_RHOVT|nr:DUF4160 domain-containing protein [Rhodomicrobium vannielii]ADP71661.1 hypothetical protein Rvan_2441 [Rhodomicrobium vannielii ATCC 17100]
MVTIHRAFGFRVVIYPGDHEPAHVHVTKGGGMAVINLVGPDGKPDLVRTEKLKTKEIRDVMRVVAEKPRSVFGAV